MTEIPCYVCGNRLDHEEMIDGGHVPSMLNWRVCTPKCLKELAERWIDEQKLSS